MSSDTILNLWKKNLGQVPSSVWDNVSLEALILADNGLIEVSARLGQLKSLRMLDLGHNQLSTIPETIGELLGLSDYLYLHDNRLASVPASIRQLSKLRYLNLSENSFSELPKSVCAMSKANWTSKVAMAVWKPKALTESCARTQAMGTCG